MSVAETGGILSQPSRVLPWFRGLSLFATLSVFALVVLGAVVRVTGSGLGCPDWPLCHGGVPLEKRDLADQFSRSQFRQRLIVEGFDSYIEASAEYHENGVWGNALLDDRGSGVDDLFLAHLKQPQHVFFLQLISQSDGCTHFPYPSYSKKFDEILSPIKGSIGDRSGDHREVLHTAAFF